MREDNPQLDDQGLSMERLIDTAEGREFTYKSVEDLIDNLNLRANEAMSGKSKQAIRNIWKEFEDDDQRAAIDYSIGDSITVATVGDSDNSNLRITIYGSALYTEIGFQTENDEVTIITETSQINRNG